MARPIQLNIDGKPVTTQEGTLLIEVAKALRIEIPTLCYSNQLEPYGGCRMCCVEVDNGSGKRLVVACGYPAEDGLKVWTRSPEIDRIRRMIVELAAPLVAPSGCLKGKMGRFGTEYHARLDEFMARSVADPNGCTLCGLCAGICSDVVGSDTIGFVGRGIHRQVVRFPAADCDYPTCRKCFAVCFTGKIAADADETVFPGASVNDFLKRRGVTIQSLRALVSSDEEAVSD